MRVHVRVCVCVCLCVYADTVLSKSLEPPHFFVYTVTTKMANRCSNLVIHANINENTVYKAETLLNLKI